MPQYKHNDILFLFNPNSGRKKYKPILRQLQVLAPDIAFAVCPTAAALDNAFEKYLVEKNVFVIVGGDGSVHQAAKHLLHKSDKCLAVYPNGSGNGFANETGFTANLPSLLEKIKKGKTKQLDALDLNGHTCINVAGLGIDGAVSHAFASALNRGLWQYIRLTIKIFFGFKPFKLELTINGEIHIEELLMITLANTRQFGNNAIISPNANPQDGILNITLLRPFPLYLFPIFSWRLFKGTLKPGKYIHFLASDNAVEINANNTQLHIDGEPRNIPNPINVKVAKGALRIISV